MNKYPVPNTKSCVVDTYPFIYTSKLHIVNIYTMGEINKFDFPASPGIPRMPPLQPVGFTTIDPFMIPS